ELLSRSRGSGLDPSEDQPENACVICLASPRECVLLPCGHVCCCFRCFQALPSHTCPICRSRISRVVPLYQGGEQRRVLPHPPPPDPGCGEACGTLTASEWQVVQHLAGAACLPGLPSLQCQNCKLAMDYRGLPAYLCLALPTDG
uniref:RING-type domain-containing protein n=1 Tax=Varanus komodoensis TaxID=61221 RepID=A0A8D2L4Y1_VARKO